MATTDSQVHNCRPIYLTIQAIVRKIQHFFWIS